MNKGVLIIDDEFDIVILLALLLKGEYKIFKATNMKDAMIQFHQNIDDIDAIITDHYLATNITSVDVIDYIRKHKPEMPILVITGHMKTRLEDLNLSNTDKVDIMYKPVARLEIRTKLEELFKK